MISIFTSPIPDPEDGSGRREREQLTAGLLLEQAFGIPVTLDHYPDGAPFVREHPGHFISISHSASICVLVLSDAPVGVDIESPRPQLERVKGKFMSAEELASLSELTPSSLLPYWTAKEAVYKLLRRPSLPLCDIHVSPAQDSASACGIECTLTFRPLGEELMAIARLTESHS